MSAPMEPFDLLTSLPATLACIVLEDWLILKSVIVLDTSYCSKAHRKKFLELLQCDEFYIREKLTISESNGILNDLFKFGEKIRAVSFEDSLNLAQAKLLAVHCHHLTHVHYNGLESCTPEMWSLLNTNPHIEVLSVSMYSRHFAHFTVPVWRGIALPQLRALSITGGWVTSELCLSAMKGSNGIVRLDFANSKINHSTLLQIPQLCPLLISLGLKGTKLNDQCLSEITAACRQIIHLDVSYNDKLTDKGILSMVQHLQGLESLNIEGVEQLTDASLVHIYTHCAATLHTLYFDSLNSGPMYEADVVCDLFKHCLQLRKVCFFLDPALQETFGCMFPQSALDKLTTLILRGIYMCEDNLFAIGTCCMRLRTLSLASCDAYSIESLISVCNGCTELERLYLDAEPEEEEQDGNTHIREVSDLHLLLQTRPGLVIEQKELDAHFSVIDI